MGSRRHTRAQWRQWVLDWPDSGLSQAAYCRQHSIRVASRHRWRAIFRHEDSAEELSSGKSLQLLPVSLPEPVGRPEAGICVVLREGLRLELGVDFQPSTLKRVLDVLRATP
jgi:hypothetical protein